MMENNSGHDCKYNCGMLRFHRAPLLRKIQSINQRYINLATKQHFSVITVFLSRVSSYFTDNNTHFDSFTHLSKKNELSIS